MRLLVSSSIFLLVMLIALESASAKKCGRENSCRKERSAAALEKSKYSEKDCATKYNHDESRNRKRRAVDEYELEVSNRKAYSKSDEKFEEDKDSRKKSRMTEKQKKGRGEEKRSRRKEETKSCNVDKRKCKFDSKSSREQRKSSGSKSEEKTCRHCPEDSSEYADNSDEDIIPNHEESEEDTSASDDSE